MSILTIHKSLDGDVLTRNEARELFSCCRLSYDDVSENDIYMLEAFVGCELSQFNELNELQMYLSHRKKDAPKINVRDKPGNPIESAFLHVDGDYFKGREAISFNSDGFIGFAGWADDGNVQPFLRAFVDWVVFWMDGK